MKKLIIFVIKLLILFWNILIKKSIIATYYFTSLVIFYFDTGIAISTLFFHDWSIEGKVDS